MPSHARLVDLAMLLRAAAPDTWEAFTVAMREYAAAQTADMVRCDPVVLQRAQGMAIAANEISAILQNAPKLKEQMLNGQRTQPARQHAQHPAA